MKNILFLILFSLFIIGCSNKQPNEYSSKEYKNINKDAILNAAKTVIKLSDKDFAIDAKRTSLEAIKISPIFKGLTVDINVNTINMVVYPDDNITRAKVKFTRKNNILTNQERVLLGSIHELFWNRVDYILGLNDRWTTCTSYRLQMNADGVLCDIVHNQNNQHSKEDIIKEIGFYEKNISNEIEIKLVDIDTNDMFKIELPLQYEIITDDINSSNMDDIELILEEVLEDQPSLKSN